jgi:hypothetical protein
MEQLELKYYSEEHVTPHEEAYLWHQSNPGTGFVLEDGGRIAAFTDILPVKRDIFDRIAAGKFNDKYLKAEDLLIMDDLKAGDEVNLLLSCVLVDEEYRETDALKILLGAHLGYYRGFTDKGIIIGDVVTSNVTEAGERFSERMGFERIGRSEHQTTLYRTAFQQLYEQALQIKPRLEEKLIQLEQNLLDPGFYRDIDNLNGCLAADFMEFGQSGTVYDRETTIRLLAAAENRNIGIRDFSIRCLSSHAAVAHYTAISVKKDGTENNSLRTSIWVKEEDRWKLLFHQGTGIQG